MDGTLDGRIGDGPAIADAVERLNELKICEFELEQDGGKYSLMPSNQRVAGDRFDSRRQDELLVYLRAIAAATRGAVESTLRCTMVFEDECAETLFRGVAPPPGGEGIEPLTRVRPVRSDDLPPEMPEAPPWRQMLFRREVMIAVPLLVIAFSLLGWQSGLVDRLLAANARGIVANTGAFGDLAEVEIVSDWGNYKVLIQRGVGYPSTSEEWDARATATEPDRLRDAIMREGQDVWVQLRNEQGNVLEQQSVSLRPLVTEATATVELRLPGRITATQVVLSVNKSERPR